MPRTKLSVNPDLGGPAKIVQFKLLRSGGSIDFGPDMIVLDADGRIWRRENDRCVHHYPPHPPTWRFIDGPPL